MSVIYIEMMKDGSLEEVNFKEAEVKIGQSGSLLISIYDVKPGEMSTMCYAPGVWKTFNVIEGEQ